MASRKRNRSESSKPSVEETETTLAEVDEDAGEPARKRRTGAEPARRRVSEETAEKAKDAAKKESPRATAAREGARTRRRRVAAVEPNPRWLVPLALTLLIAGLVYLVTYYLSAGTLPLPIQDWNLAVGFGSMILGGGLLMFWK